MRLMDKVGRSIWRSLAGFLVAGLLAGCGGVDVYDGPTGAVGDAPPEGIDIIRVGERITVVFTDIPTPPPPIEQRIREDGTVSLPYNESFVAAGKGVTELEGEIRDRYRKYYNRITVNVRIEGRVIHVGGQVRLPGRYDYIGQMTVLDAIKVAGEFTDFARRSRVRVTRVDGREIIVDCKRAIEDPLLDAPIYPGDSIYVPRKIL